MNAEKNIETDFIQFIIDKYSPNTGATASKNSDDKPSDEQSENNDDNDDENQEVVEKLLLEYKKIKDKYEYYSHKVKEGEQNYYDFSTIKELLNMDRSKLQRDLRRIAKTDFIKYRNQHLYKQQTLFSLMEEQLMKGLDKIESSFNEYS